MTAMTNITEIQAGLMCDNQMSMRQRVAGFLAEIPEPAAQSAAIQLLKTKITLDRSFAFFMGALVMVIAEELL